MLPKYSKDWQLNQYALYGKVDWSEVGLWTLDQTRVIFHFPEVNPIL